MASETAVSDVRTGSAIAVRGLDHWFGTGEARKQVLYDIDLDVDRGTFTVLMGASGSGKTTLLTLIGCLRRVEAGDIDLLGTRLAGASEDVLVACRRRLGFIFQLHNLHDSLTAMQNVRMGLEVHGPQAMVEWEAASAHLLSALGLAERLDYLPAKLSGGQKQRDPVGELPRRLARRKDTEQRRVRQQQQRREQNDRDQHRLTVLIVPDLDRLLVRVRHLVARIVARRLEHVVAGLPRDHADAPADQHARHRVKEHQDIGDEETDRADEMQALVDPALMVEPMIIPALAPEFLHDAVEHAALRSCSFVARASAVRRRPPP